MAAFFKVDNRFIQWHVGEPIPDAVLDQRVVTVQLDGHELEAALDGMSPRTYNEKDT